MGVSVLVTQETLIVNSFNSEGAKTLGPIHIWPLRPIPKDYPCAPPLLHFVLFKGSSWPCNPREVNRFRKVLEFSSASKMSQPRRSPPLADLFLHGSLPSCPLCHQLASSLDGNQAPARAAAGRCLLPTPSACSAHSTLG